MTVLGLTTLSIVTGSTGALGVIAGLAVILCGAPLQAWARARRAAGVLHAHAHASPALVPVGAASSLEVVVVNTARRSLPASGIDNPDRWWRPVSGLVDAVHTASPPGAKRALRLAPVPHALVHVPSLRPGASARDRFAVPTDRRALLALAPLPLWVHDAVGLFGTVVATAPRVVVAVYPCVAETPAVELAPAADTAGLFDAATRAVTQSESGGGEFADLRPYVPGDRLHLLHWPAFARHGALFVRRFDAEESGVVHIVLDDRPGVHRPGEFEDTVSATLALVQQAGHRGWTVDFATLSGERISVSPSQAGQEAVLPLLSAVRPRVGSFADGSASGARLVEGAYTVVTTSTGALRLSDALRRHALVVTA